MLAGTQPAAFDQGRLAQRGAAHDVSPGNTGFEIAADFYRELVAAQGSSDLTRLLDPASPDPYGSDRAHRCMAQDHVGRQLTSPDHQQALRIGSREILRGERRGGPGTPQCQLVAVQYRSRRACVGIEQNITGMHCRQAAQRIVREYGYQLYADATVGAPARHDQQSLSCISASEVMTLPHREHTIGRKSAFQAIYQRAACQAAGQLGTIEMQQNPAPGEMLR